MNPFVLPTKFTAVDEVTGRVRRMAHNVNDAFNRMGTGIARQERLFRRLTPGIGDATKQLLSYVGAGSVLAGIGFSGKAVMDHETAIQSLSAVTGITGAELENLKIEIDDVAKVTSKSATDIAGSYEVIGSAMSQYLQDPQALRQISMAGITLAKASRQELVPSLEQLTNIMNQFELGADKASDTVNRLTAGEIVGSLRTSQVAEALQKFGAGAFAANIDLSESVALVETLGKKLTDAAEIGTGARNILTVMDSATGLAKKARKELRHAGVDMHVLMDSSRSLSERLHELAKVQDDAKAITKIFGRENKTAAQIVFQQLDLYDQFVAKIRQTNAAEEQAAINSRTLQMEVDRMKNTWLNYLTASDGVNSGLDNAKSLIGFVADNMGTLVSTGVTVIKLYALWKAAIIAQKAVMIGSNVVLGVQNALFASSVGLLEANVAAQKVAIVTKRGLGIATQVLSGNFAALNAVMAANPIGLTITALTALAGAMYFASQRNKELRAQYQQRINMSIPAEVDKERQAVEKLVEQYVMLGKSIQKANAIAMNDRMMKFEEERRRSEEKIAELQRKLDEMKVHATTPHGAAGAAIQNWLAGNSDVAQQLSAEQTNAKELAIRQNFLVQRAKESVDMGVVRRQDVAAIFAAAASRKKPPVAQPTETPVGGGVDYLEGNLTPQERMPHGPLVIDYQKMREALQGSQRVVVQFVGAPAGTTVTSNVESPNSY